MSGICGLVFANGRAASGEDIERLLDPLARRGPDGSHVRLSGRAGFGHALLATTPEALRETQPFQHTETGCMITADVRLDNRKELAERLRLPQHRIEQGDAEIILLAFLAWGSACLNHLRGDFAFAIWDPRDQTVFCARDQTGMRQLVYHHVPGKIFGFATEPQALARHPDIACDINEARIGDFFDYLEAHDLESTFYTDVFKLPPAHAVKLAGDELHIWQYWQLEPQETLRLRSDGDYAAAFLDVFTQAVEVRLRSHTPVGSMLSGGLDSSAVATVAAGIADRTNGQALKTFSAVSNDPECVETNAIHAVLMACHLDPTLISLGDFESYRAALKTAAEEIEEPFDWYMNLIRAVYHAASEQGVNVMLDGVGGDTTLGTGSVVRSYLGEQRVFSALREIRGERRFWGEFASPLSSHAKDALRTLLPENMIRHRTDRFRERRIAETASDSPLTPEFAARLAMPRRRREYFERIAEPADAHKRKAKRPLHPHVIVARERYDRVASAFAIEPRDPFLDVNLIEFCLSLPTEQLHKDGWPKRILRNAMEGHLPEPVRWRKGRMHLGSMFTNALWSGETTIVGEDERRILQGFIKHELLSRDVTGRQKGVVADADTELENALRLSSCARWLIRANTALHKGVKA